MSNNWDISLGFHIVLIVYWAFVRGIGRRRGKLAPGYKLIQNATNRYMQDRESMKTQSFSGIPDFPSQDTCVVEGEGPIQDRTREHLVSSDKVIVTARKLLLRAIKDVQESREPLHVIRESKLNRFPNMLIWYGVVPSSLDWKEHCRQLEAELKV